MFCALDKTLVRTNGEVVRALGLQSKSRGIETRSEQILKKAISTIQKNARALKNEFPDYAHNLASQSGPRVFFEPSAAKIFLFGDAVPFLVRRNCFASVGWVGSVGRAWRVWSL